MPPTAANAVLPPAGIQPVDDRSREPLDPKLRDWLNEEINHRLLPQHWPAVLQQLVSWAQTYPDGVALHALLVAYPRQKAGTP
jgi:hypothetical protein